MQFVPLQSRRVNDTNVCVYQGDRWSIGEDHFLRIEIHLLTLFLVRLLLSAEQQFVNLRIVVPTQVITTIVTDVVRIEQAIQHIVGVGIVGCPARQTQVVFPST